MKKIPVILAVLSLFCLPTFAETSQNNIGKYPAGTFKKAHNGKIIQYDKNGKKIGMYKIKNRKYVKIK